MQEIWLIFFFTTLGFLLLSKIKSIFRGVDVQLPPTAATTAKCKNSDCWKQALYALDYCLSCATEQSNQYLYRHKETKELEPFMLEDRKAKWSSLSARYQAIGVDFSILEIFKNNFFFLSFQTLQKLILFEKPKRMPNHNLRRATISSTMSSPMPHSLSYAQGIIIFQPLVAW